MLYTTESPRCHLLQEARISFAELQLVPATLAQMISLIEANTISGKIGKQILPDLLEVRATRVALFGRCSLAPAAGISVVLRKLCCLDMGTCAWPQHAHAMSTAMHQHPQPPARNASSLEAESAQRGSAAQHTTCLEA
jgi:GatB domain